MGDQQTTQKTETKAGGNAEQRTYQGGCQCGAVRYEVTTDLGTVIECNCSMCGKAGTMLNFVPATAFSLKSGEDVLSDYQFNKHAIHHLFCSRCGIKSFARGKNKDGSDMVAVNVRCFDDVDARLVKTTFFDGKSR